MSMKNNQINTDKVKMEEPYLSCIHKLHDDKVEINRVKISNLGHINADDHGFVYFPDFQYTPEFCEDGLVHGGMKIAANFRKMLNEMPAYVNASSALAGTYAGMMKTFMPLSIPESAYDPEIEAVAKKYGMLQTGFDAMNHFCPDMSIGLELGWNGLLEKIRYYRKKNHPTDTEFYDSEEVFVIGVLEWVERLAKEAEAQAEECADEWKTANLKEIASINRRLLTEAPQTFREACQFLAHFQTLDRMFWSGGAIGYLDQLLEDYFNRDLENGVITEAEATWIIASLFFNDTHYGQLGGVAPAGDVDITNRLSFVILDAIHHLNIPTNMAVRVHEKLPGQSDAAEVLLRRAVEYTFEDGTGVCYSMEKGTVEGYVKNGYSEVLGRMKCKCGCNWTAIPGIEYPFQDVTRVNMAMALQYALGDLKNEEIRSTERLFELFAYHLDQMISCVKKGYDRRYEVFAKHMPEIVLNLFMHGTLERGVDASCGGVDIMNFNIDGIALATVADSFAAIEQRVVEEKQLSWDRLFELLEMNYEDGERERLLLKNIQRLGVPDSRAEFWAYRVKDEFVRQCTESRTSVHNLLVVPGLFSHGDVLKYGEITAATPNGRKAGEFISHSSEPDPGFAIGLDSFSPVLKATAVAKMQTGYGNSAPLHLDVDLDIVKNAGGVDALVALLHAHEQMGGTLVNLNCLKKETLLAAHERPEEYPDLLVRVTGYSAFFASLSREYRQQIVDRFLAE